jgi:sarcosine oxidase / L-pipecolate oxidase
MPPTSDGLMKFVCEESFTNNQHHKASNQTISVPPTPISQSTWSHDVPQALKEDVLKVVKNTYGKELDGIEVENYRMCWYECCTGTLMLSAYNC